MAKPTKRHPVVNHLRPPRQGYDPDVRLRAKTIQSAKKVASKNACRKGRWSHDD